MSRSLYKPCISEDLQLLNLSEKQKAFYRVEDQKGRRIYRLASCSGASYLTEEHIHFRILLYMGKQWKPMYIIKKMVGFRLGEFKRTKKTGPRIHFLNRTERKRRKLRERLKLEAKQRKNRKKSDVVAAARKKAQAKKKSTKAVKAVKATWAKTRR